MPVTQRSSLPFCRRLNAIIIRCHRLFRIANDRYRPELHYMRGPGPKWHEKHQGRTDSGALF